MIRLDGTVIQQLFDAGDDWSDVQFEGVFIDSRKDCSGGLFIAIHGENFDGHDFVAAAVAKGAVAVMTERHIDVAAPQVMVADCRAAMGKLATYWRRQVNPKLIAITGSNGKTTVKEMLGRILAASAPTLVTQGNLNNDIGVPLTLFRLSPEQAYAVIEMGANHLNEIHQLVNLSEPDVVYVNNAHSAHVEGFGSRQGVIRAKGEMYQFAPTDSVAVFNEDEDAVEYWKSIATSRDSISFSLRQHSEISASFVQQANTLHIEVSRGQESTDTEIQLQGWHNAQNAVAAISLAIAVGVEMQEAAGALGGYRGVSGRQQFTPGLNHSVLIDDSYNANPDSLRAAIEVLCTQEGEKWLALGDMAELGEDAQRLHDEVVEHARDRGVDEFFALGPLSGQSARIFAERGHQFDSHDLMAQYLAARLERGVYLLIKGSRSARMEKLVAALRPPMQSGDRYAV
jgi:UDP-N-acetylmuramoyl-tripeptide--D-alanyl-D-alanine ligase